MLIRVSFSSSGGGVCSSNHGEHPIYTRTTRPVTVSPNASDRRPAGRPGTGDTNDAACPFPHAPRVLAVALFSADPRRRNQNFSIGSRRLHHTVCVYHAFGWRSNSTANSPDLMITFVVSQLHTDLFIGTYV